MTKWQKKKKEGNLIYYYANYNFTSLNLLHNTLGNIMKYLLSCNQRLVEDN